MTDVQHNRQVTLKSRPGPDAAAALDNFGVITQELHAAFAAGDVLIQLLYLSVDPYSRGMMNAGSEYPPSYQLGKPLNSGGIGRVAATNNDGFSVGDIVSGWFDWANYTTVAQGAGLTKIDNPADLPLSYHLGALGLTGWTAYCGLLAVGQPEQGDTVYVSTAAGAVGHIAGQIAKIKGCRVIGSAGSDAKVTLLKEKLGFDAAFNYRTSQDYAATLRELCPNGIDVYFDNVGGKMLEAVLDVCSKGARIAACGMISDYNKKDKYGITNLFNIITKEITIKGVWNMSYLASMEAEFKTNMTQWLKEGRISYVEDVTDGLENAPKAFLGMMRGDSNGKATVKIADDTGTR